MSQSHFFRLRHSTHKNVKIRPEYWFYYLFPYYPGFITHTHTHTHTLTYTHIHTHIHTYTHIDTLTYTHTHTYTLIHTHSHTHTHRYTHTHTYTHTYTHIITDSRISLDSINNVNNHSYLIEEIRKRLSKLERSNWTVAFAWVKAHAGILGNELAD